MLELKLDQLVQTGENAYTAEISELRPDGSFPPHFSVPELRDVLSGAVFFLRENLFDSQGEFYGAIYRQAMGPNEVTIFND